MPFVLIFFPARLSRKLLIVLLLAVPTALTAQVHRTPLRVAVVGLVHGHVEGFLAGLPHHTDVELVGIADSDPALFARYQKKYALPATVFYRQEANMIEKTHPQAVLVYTSIADHRAAIEIAAQYGVSAMVEKPLTISLDDALAIRRTARHYHIHVLVNYETTWYSDTISPHNGKALLNFAGKTGLKDWMCV